MLHHLSLAVGALHSRDRIEVERVHHEPGHYGGEAVVRSEAIQFVSGVVRPQPNEATGRDAIFHVKRYSVSLVIDIEF